MATFNDQFNRADGALGANWAPSVSGRDLQIVNQRARAGSATACEMYATALVSGADQVARVQIATLNTSSDIGLLLRTVESGDRTFYTFIAFGPGNPYWQITTRVAGNEIEIGLGLFQFHPGDIVEARAIGTNPTTLTMLCNGVVIAVVQDRTSGLQGANAGHAGMRIRYTDVIADAEAEWFEAGDAVAYPDPLFWLRHRH